MACQDQSIQVVLQALQTLYHDPQGDAKKRANEWLEEFQHSVEAWQTCHSLLTESSTPLEGRLFSAQTIRSKILYDLSQLPVEQQLPLRDSLLSSLVTTASQPGSRAVIRQLCLALSDLALQSSQWADPCDDMIKRYGQDPSTVPTLLAFLQSFAEESMNSRVALSSQYLDGIGPAFQQVLNILTLYINAPGITSDIQVAVFESFRSWIITGEMEQHLMIENPLFNALFEALPSDPLFDAAVDALCDVIHETRELVSNPQFVSLIIPRLVALRPQLEEHKEDPDRIRGYCRILCEAGECYNSVIVKHPTEMLPLVEAIAQCAAYPDLDIVPITFNFWYEVATALGRQPIEPQFKPLLDIFESLQTVIINHLHFPPDNDSQTAQERDDFRTFRHRMGDTLKDCCHVLGAPSCLRKSYDLVVAALGKPSPSWQEIEAPLFSMRSMGAQVDPNDDEILPHIMEMLPRLPDHPRIRYAAILVISRYTAWIDRHPENITFQLQYISAGFEMANEEVAAAAAQAMKFMCQDCQQHLVPFLPQLFTFTTTAGDRLDQADMVEVCEAIGYIISSMPVEDGARALQQFCEPLIQRVQSVASASTEAPKAELQKVADALERLDAFLSVVGEFDPLPSSCMATPQTVYAVLDQLIARYSHLYYISERVGSVLRRGLAFFPITALQPVLPPVLERMASTFATTHYASYLWIIGKIAGKLGASTSGAALGAAETRLVIGAFESVTTELERLLTTKQAIEIPDVMDDYAHTFMSYLTHLSDATVPSPCLSTATHMTINALACPAPETIIIALDTLATLSQRLSHPQFQPLIQPIFAQWGKHLMIILLSGITQGFPEDVLEQVRDILTRVSQCSPPEAVEAWTVEGLEKIPGNLLPQNEKQAFVSKMHEHLLAPEGDALRNAVNGLVRAARRARDRGRQSRKSLGAM
ncbi:armadillo-type protein [Kockovaella imperatae]|uniref:Armadillo-type protein n=1 Tax=Kockovaella imperatae TaxID=4999 RepID=A0A1Y1UIW3_9TREE|nr:armadillo-type protein [Kockovaella imperatae]ORX37045.1 armadillo-type protein [Kockovaella imperatae]